MVTIETGWRYDNEIVFFMNSYEDQLNIKPPFNDLCEEMMKQKISITIISSFFVRVNYKIYNIDIL